MKEADFEADTVGLPPCDAFTQGRAVIQRRPQRAFHSLILQRGEDLEVEGLVCSTRLPHYKLGV